MGLQYAQSDICHLLLWNFLLDILLINGDIRCQSQLLWLAKTGKGRLLALTVMAFEEKSKDKETFIVRHAKSLDDLQWVMKMATEVGFRPREKEAECYFSAGLTPYFYIGELKGKRIACASQVEHSESVSFGGYYIVDKPYRGSGFGKKVFESCLALSDQCNIQTLSVMNLKDYHLKRGFQLGWVVKTYQFIASHAVEGLASTQLPTSVKILPASQADFEKLFAYGADMMGTSQICKELLAQWLSHLQESSWVAIDNTGEVVGYLIMSKLTCFPEQGYCIAPFYADGMPVARSLLKVAVEFASANNPRHKVTMDIPVYYNKEGVSLLEKEIGAKPTKDLVFMCSKELPNKRLSKVFSVASTQVL